MPLPKKYVILIVVFFMSVVVGAIILFTRNQIRYNKELKFLAEKEIKGCIVALKDENRGSYYLEIKTSKEIFRIHSLPIAWEIKEYNIQVGDSVSKEANSKVMTFYKIKSGAYEKCCDYEM